MRRRVLFAVLLVVGAGAGLFAVPAMRDRLLGAWHGEPTKDGRYLRTWLRELRSGDEPTRERAALALGEMGAVSPDVVPALQAALGEKSRSVRLTAAEALGKLGPAGSVAIPELRQMVQDADVNLRRPAARALGRLGAAEAVPELIAMARKDEFVAARVDAIQALGRIGPAAHEAVPALLEALHDPVAQQGDPGFSAAEALRSIGPDPIENLRAGCRQTSPIARGNALQVVAEMGEKGRALTPVVRKLLRDADKVVRLRAAVTLWKLEKDAPAVMPILVAALGDPSSATWGDAAVTAGEIGPGAVDAIPSLTKALTYKELDSVRGTAAVALGRIGPPARSAVDALEILANNDKESRSVRDKAATALAAIRGEKPE